MRSLFFFFFNDTATTEIYTLSLHDALPILVGRRDSGAQDGVIGGAFTFLAQARTGQPNERMEPIEAASEFGANLQEPVMAGDMRKLMRKHDAAAGLSPKRSAGKEHHDRDEGF